MPCTVLFPEVEGLHCLRKNTSTQLVASCTPVSVDNSCESNDLYQNFTLRCDDGDGDGNECHETPGYCTLRLTPDDGVEFEILRLGLTRLGDCHIVINYGNG